MEVSKDTKFTLSIESMVTIGIALVSMTGMYFTLNAQINEAMKQPEPPISRAEYDLKDNAIRTEIMSNRDLIERNFHKLEEIEKRIYELK